MKQRAVFLDRDGTLNAMVYNADFGLVDSPLNSGEFELLPGVGEAIRSINEMGLLAIVVSNQPGIAKGKLTLELLNEMTRKMHSSLARFGAHVDSVYYCLHHPQAKVSKLRVECDCRKPRAGLLLKAADEWDVNLRRSYLIGDGISDVVAGSAVGNTTLFLNRMKCYACEELGKQGAKPDIVADDLPKAVEMIYRLERGDEPVSSLRHESCASIPRV